MIHNTSVHVTKMYVSMSLFTPSFVKHKNRQITVRKGKSSLN